MLVFAGCTGPRGLRAVDGTVDITTTASSAAVTATDFQIGRTVLDVDALISFTPGSLTVTTTSTGIGPLGRDIEHDGAYTLSWTPTCVTLDGAWSTSGSDRGRSTSANVTRCLDECPVGEVTRNTVDGRTIELAFDGTATAQWTTSNGRSGSFPLACGL